MFLLAVSGVFTMMQGWNDGTAFATTNFFVSGWSFLASRVCPLGASIALSAAVISYVRNQDWMRYVLSTLALLSVSGTKSAAIDLYQVRKADALAGRKLPELRTSKVVTLADLIDDALEFVAHHKDKRNYNSKAAIVREALGSSPAADLTPQELERWLRGQCKTPATSNRYKAFISLCYRERSLAQSDHPAIPGAPGGVCGEYSHRDETERAILLRMVAGASRPPDDRANKNEKRLGEDHAFE